nr:carboxypeptidase regulatory-like domain-containing protein [Micromonospora fulviviridis]
MSTHRRAWKQRAGVVVALVFGALLAVPATPASAANPDVQITNLPTGTLQSGQQTRMTFSVKNNNDVPTVFSINVGTFNGLNCQGECSVPARPIQPGQTESITVTLVADNIAQGTTKSGQVRVSAKAGGDQASDARDMTVQGQAAPPTQQQTQTVKSISGKVVVAANSEPIAGAVVMLRDSQGKQRQASTDGSGNFRFTGSTSDPIAPGRIDLGANKDGKIGTKSFDAAAGQSVTGLRVSVPIQVEASPSPTPSASDEALPSDEATDEATDEPASQAPAAQQPAANEDSGGFGSWLLILLGGLFVAVGVGTIVLLYMRRKNEDGDGDGDGPHGPTGPGGPAGAAGAVPGARGAYRGADDQTRVVNGMGAGPAPTMVGGTSLSDAPTMMHRPVVDDVPPDPYGAPPGPAYGAGAGAGAGAAGWAGNGYGDEAHGQGGYGGGDNGYGAAPASGGGYGAAPASGGGYGTAPSSGGGYGSRDYGAGAAGYPPAQGGGYGNERYDEPTGRYTGDSTQYAPPADPYPTSTYQPDQARGYDQPGQGQYGRGPEQGGNGYGSGGGYGAPAGGYDNAPAGGYGNAPGGGFDGAPAGGYDSGQTGGYDSRQAGYDGGQQGGYDGYDQRGGYGGGNGYGQPQQGGYGQPGGYGQEQPPQQRGGGYDNQGYDQGGYYADPAEAGRGRPDAPQDRGGRRLDWLDD